MREIWQELCDFQTRILLIEHHNHRQGLSRVARYAFVFECFLHSLKAGCVQVLRGVAVDNRRHARILAMGKWQNKRKRGNNRIFSSFANVSPTSDCFYSVDGDGVCKYWDLRSRSHTAESRIFMIFLQSLAPIQTPSHNSKEGSGRTLSDGWHAKGFSCQVLPGQGCRRQLLINSCLVPPLHPLREVQCQCEHRFCKTPRSKSTE